MNLGGGALANKGEACLAPTCGGCMDKEAIARHLGVDSVQIISARPEDDGYRVLVDYGIGGIKVFHVPPAEASSPEPAKASSPNPEPAEASSPSQEPAKALSPEPAEASSPVVVVSDKSVARKPVARKPVARAKT